MPYRVIIADDHPALLMGIKAILENSDNIKVVGEATTPKMLLGILEHIICDALILDYSMPDEMGESGQDGLSLLKKIKQAHPKLPIILFTMINNVALLRMAIEMGVNAVISKSDNISELPKVIMLVCAGHTFVSQIIAKEMAERGLNINTEKIKKLSKRQMEVLNLFLSGLTIKEVAQTLSISPNTVSNQIRTIKEIWGIKTKLELMNCLQAMELE